MHAAYEPCNFLRCAPHITQYMTGHHGGSQLRVVDCSYNAHCLRRHLESLKIECAVQSINAVTTDSDLGMSAWPLGLPLHRHVCHRLSQLRSTPRPPAPHRQLAQAPCSRHHRCSHRCRAKPYSGQTIDVEAEPGREQEASRGPQTAQEEWPAEFDEYGEEDEEYLEEEAQDEPAFVEEELPQPEAELEQGAHTAP